VGAALFIYADGTAPAFSFSLESARMLELSAVLFLASQTDQGVE
jgi:hypothetical protein